MGYFKSMAIDLQEANMGIRDEDPTIVSPIQACGPGCSECGGMGYTLENSVDGEAMVSCRLGWERGMDALGAELELESEIDRLQTIEDINSERWSGAEEVEAEEEEARAWDEACRAMLRAESNYYENYEPHRLDMEREDAMGLS
jgi:hypothetical protein